MSGHIRQRVLIAAAVAFLFLLAAGTAVSAGAPSPTQKDEYTAAVNTQPSVFGPFVATPFVYVAAGVNFPDALGAGPAAGVAKGPVLLVSKSSIPAATKAELTRLGPKEIFVVGGTAVISPTVETQLAAYAPKVTRLAGPNRYETAAQVSKAAFPVPSTFVVAHRSEETTMIADSCTDYDGMVLPITVPGPGTIVVTANVNPAISHTKGAWSEAALCRSWSKAGRLRVSPTPPESTAAERGIPVLFSPPRSEGDEKRPRLCPFRNQFGCTKP